MEIEVKLFATLSPYLPENAKSLPVDTGETVDTVIDKLGLPRDEVRLIFVNGIRSKPETPLKHRDRLSLFPVVGGG